MAGDGPRKSLGDLEARVMKAVWRLFAATVREVRDALPGRRRLAYTTVLTTLRNLERKGWLAHRKEGRRHVYFPLVEERAAARSALKDLVDRLFDGSRVRLADALFGDEELTPEEFDRLRAEILKLRGEEGDGGGA